MNILCVVDGFFPSAGGSEKQAILIAENMVARGHHVDYACPWLDPSQPKSERLNGIACRRLGFLRVPGLASATYVASAAVFLLFNGHRYDVIHIHMVEKFALALACVKPLVRAEVVAKVAGATEFDGGVFDERKSSWLARLVRRLVLKIGVFQAISAETLARLKNLGLLTNSILVLPNAIDLDRFTPSRALHQERETERVVLAFTGRLVKEKALPDLIDAVALLRERGVRNAVLRLAGDGPMREPLMRQIESLDLGDYVEFVGEIDNVDDFLSSAHVYCQVSSIEGLSNSVLEAMASALPCVLTRISGNVDLLQEGRNGLGVDVGNSVAIADALQSLIGDRALCRAMGQHAREGVEARYSVDRVVSALEQCYHGNLPSPAFEHS